MGRDSLWGKTAIVTGATGGIGKSICTKLASREMNIVVVGRNEAKLNEIATSVVGYGGRSLKMAGDITDSKFIDKLLKETVDTFEKVDIVINCAGIAHKDDFSDVSEELYDKIMEVNVKAPYFLCQKALPYLRKSGFGTIINVSSVVGHKGYPQQSVYAASKHALIGWSKSLANEVYQDNIRVHVVSPGGVYTDMVALTRPDLSEEGMPRPEDCAEVIEFLLDMRKTNAVIDEIEFHRTNKAPFA